MGKIGVNRTGLEMTVQDQKADLLATTAPVFSGPRSAIVDPKWAGRSTFTVLEAGEILGLSKSTAYAAANEGALPTIRMGRRLIVPRRALERLLGG